MSEQYIFKVVMTKRDYMKEYTTITKVFGAGKVTILEALRLCAALETVSRFPGSSELENLSLATFARVGMQSRFRALPLSARPFFVSPKRAGEISPKAIS